MARRLALLCPLLLLGGCQRVERAPTRAWVAPRTAGAPTTKAASRPTTKPTRIAKLQLRKALMDSSGDTSLSGAKRVRAALKRARPIVKKLFAKAGVRFPPRELLFRVYKEEEHLEVWARASRRARFVRVAIYKICSTSGALGPKKREGDGQVPEGFYSIDFYHPRSTYYLAMRINYPNRRDRKLKYTGSAIMIHGNCVSVGCLAMTDARIEELWAITDGVRRKRRVRVNIYPQRDLKAAIAKADSVKLKAFWRNLAAGHAYFDKHGRLPRVGVDKQGRYSFK
jgi:murein L,D-transpeptidase YafK